MALHPSPALRLLRRLVLLAAPAAAVAGPRPAAAPGPPAPSPAGLASPLPSVVSSPDPVDGLWNVRLYGAKGDGAADDTAPIQAAIGAVPAAGGIVYFPPGRYKITSALTTKPAITLRGAGKEASLITSGTMAGSAIKSLSPINGSTAVHLVIEDLGLDNTNAANAGAGIEEVGGSFVHIRRVKITGFKYGVLFDQTELGDIDLCDFEGQSRAGVWLVNGGWTPGARSRFTNRITVQRCQLNFNTASAYGILDDGGEVHQFLSNNYNGGGTQIRIAGVNAGVIRGGEFEGASRPPILVSNYREHGGWAGASVGLSIENNYILPGIGGTAAVHFAGAGSVGVAHNVVATSGSALTGCANVGELVEIGNVNPVSAGQLRDGQATNHVVLGGGVEASGFTGLVDARGLTCRGKVVTAPAAGIRVSAGVTITPTGTYQPLTAAAATSMIAVPTIADGVDGQELLLLNTGAFSITLQDQGTLTGSNLRLTATSLTLGPRQSMRLLYAAAIGDWVQVAPLVAVL